MMLPVTNAPQFLNRGTHIFGVMHRTDTRFGASTSKLLVKAHLTMVSFFKETDAISWPSTKQFLTSSFSKGGH